MRRVPILRHHHLATTADRYRVEVWADMPPKVEPGKVEPVTLFVDRVGDHDSFYVELTPPEARALAALLIVSADQQERDV